MKRTLLILSICIGISVALGWWLVFQYRQTNNLYSDISVAWLKLPLECTKHLDAHEYKSVYNILDQELDRGIIEGYKLRHRYFLSSEQKKTLDKLLATALSRRKNSYAINIRVQHDAKFRQCVEQLSSLASYTRHNGPVTMGKSGATLEIGDKDKGSE